MPPLSASRLGAVAGRAAGHPGPEQTLTPQLPLPQGTPLHPSSAHQQGESWPGKSPSSRPPSSQAPPSLPPASSEGTPTVEPQDFGFLGSDPGALESRGVGFQASETFTALLSKCQIGRPGFQGLRRWEEVRGVGGGSAGGGGWVHTPGLSDLFFPGSLTLGQVLPPGCSPQGK